MWILIDKVDSINGIPVTVNIVITFFSFSSAIRRDDQIQLSECRT